MAGHSGVVGCLFLVVALLHSVTAQDTYVVLDNLGWTVPATGGDAAYRTWATGKDFEVGDTLVFNFPTGAHDVAEVSRAAYDSCNGTSPLSTIITAGPANITLATAGQHYYICTIPGHCQGGQKLAITVEASSEPNSPPDTDDEQDTYVVLDNLGWTVPATGGDAAYRTWATGKDFEVGDTLVFNFPTGAHDVAEVSRAAYDSCNGTSPLSTIITAGPANITLATAGQHYYICTIPGHCQGGQKLAIIVEASSGGNTPPSGSTPPSGLPQPGGPPSPSSASSIAFGGVISLLLSTAITFLY